ncbi:hypothetical protein [Bradyrhizobium sp.]|uniref:hypothetical protein n=1 Tax=Bradyrhizobium sp. TaxID=376 RepID=UPI003C6F6D29
MTAPAILASLIFLKNQPAPLKNQLSDPSKALATTEMKKAYRKQSAGYSRRKTTQDRLNLPNFDTVLPPSTEYYYTIVGQFYKMN